MLKALLRMYVCCIARGEMAVQMQPHFFSRCNSFIRVNPPRNSIWSYTTDFFENIVFQQLKCRSSPGEMPSKLTWSSHVADKSLKSNMCESLTMIRMQGGRYIYCLSTLASFFVLLSALAEKEIYWVITATYLPTIYHISKFCTLFPNGCNQ